MTWTKVLIIRLIMLHVCFFNVSILITYPSWSLAHIIQHYPTSDPKYKILLLRLKSAAETLLWQLISRNFSNFVSTESFEIPISSQFLFSRNWFENEASNASHVWKLNSKTSWKKAKPAFDWIDRSRFELVVQFKWVQSQSCC